MMLESAAMVDVLRLGSIRHRAGMLVIQRSIYVVKGVTARRKQAFPAVGETVILMTTPVYSLLKHLLQAQGVLSNESLADG